MILKLNVNPHDVPSWDNRVTVSRTSSIFMEESGQLHKSGWKWKCFKLERFNNNCGIKFSKAHHKKTTQNIPNVLIQCVKYILSNIVTPRVHKIKLDYEDITDTNFRNVSLLNTMYTGRTKKHTITLQILW